MQFYRFQNTSNIETNSYYVDLNMLYEDYINHNYTSLEELYAKYYNSLSLRETPPQELFRQVIQSPNFEYVDNMCETNLLNGIFGWKRVDLDEEYTLEELLTDDVALNYLSEQRYLVLYEGDLLLNEGDNGCVFRPSNIIQQWIRNV